MVGHQLADLGQGLVASHETGQLHREVVGVAVKRAQRRETSGEVGVAQLVDLDRTRQVSHAVGPEVGQAGPGGQVVGRQVG